MSTTWPLASSMTKLRRSLAGGLAIVMFILTGAANAQRSFNSPSLQASIQSEAQEESPREMANRLVDEAKALITTGTSDSLLIAYTKLTEAFSVWHKLGDRQSEAITLSYIGKVFTLSSDPQMALESYDRALKILREIGDQRGEARTLNNIGLIYDTLGEKRRALEAYNRSLPILRSLKDRATEGITLVNIGLAYDGMGEKQKALDHYLQALAIFRDVGDRTSEAVTLNNLGFLFDSLGEKDKALDYYGQALPILRAIADKRLEAVTLNNIGYVYDSLDDKQKALEYYKQALPVLRLSGDRFKEAVTINNIGLVYRSLGQLERSLDYFTQALTLRESIGDRPGLAVTNGDIGMVYDALGQNRKALDFYNESLRLSRFIEDHAVEASTLRRIALVEEKRGNLAKARASIEAALVIVESLRTKITSQDLRASYFASVQEQFETYISILMRMHRKYPAKGYHALALKASERARARSMLEMLAEAGADIREGVAPALLARERLLQHKLRQAAEKQARFFTERRTIEQITAFKKEAESPLNEYQQVETEIRSASPRYAALTQPIPLGVREIQQQTLDQDTLLLEYALGDKKSFLWLVTNSNLKSFELPPRAEIETAAKLVYALLTARNKQIKFETAEEKSSRIERADKEFETAASRLSQMLLGPVESGLGNKRLLIVGDGILDYIPFAALPVANNQATGKYRPLIADHEVVSIPSASTLALLRREMAGRKLAEKTLVVIADPVFDRDDARVNSRIDDGKVGQRVSQAQIGGRIPRLPFTRVEAEAILSLVPQTDSKRALDFEANRETVVLPELGKYRYVHFATHGILDSQNPELSGLVLSLVNHDGNDIDGFLWAHEVFNLHLPVEMVVLSGCRTGLGKEIRGEGLVGLTRGFMYAGARRVVVSLWDISDESSAELMTQFYRSMLGTRRLGPVAALRAAQLAVWRNPRWQAPYYWAAFIIQGETN